MGSALTRRILSGMKVTNTMQYCGKEAWNTDKLFIARFDEDED